MEPHSRSYQRIRKAKEIAARKHALQLPLLLLHLVLESAGTTHEYLGGNADRCGVTTNVFIALVSKLSEAHLLTEFEFGSWNLKADGNPATTTKSFNEVVLKLHFLEKLKMQIDGEDHYTFKKGASHNDREIVRFVCENFSDLKSISASKECYY